VAQVSEYLDELTRRVMNATALTRLSNVEARKVVDTVLTLHGQPLERPRLAPVEIGGAPVYAPDADHRPTETIKMDGANG
jgi:hypothetical protein